MDEASVVAMWGPTIRSHGEIHGINSEMRALTSLVGTS